MFQNTVQILKVFDFSNKKSSLQQNATPNENHYDIQLMLTFNILRLLREKKNEMITNVYLQIY